MDFDLLLSGGTVLDPASSRQESMDVGISDGKVREIAPRIEASRASELVDAAGCLITPGLIDIHVHAYAGVSHISFDADNYCATSGVTTAVDAGSSGMINFWGFRRYIAEQSRTRMLAFVHVAMYGAMRDPGELFDLRFADVEATAATIHANRDVAVGVKVRLADHHVGGNGPQALRLAIEAGEQSHTPVMVHIGHTVMSIEEIVNMLRPGDIVTHCFTPLTPTLLDESGRVRTAVLEAHERGVLFDVGPCDVDFDHHIARVCMDGGLPPDLISTDAYVNRFPRHRDPGEPANDDLYARGGHDHPEIDDLPTVLSIFLGLGMSLEAAIERCTSAPAKAIGWQDRLGRIAVGLEADLSVLKLVESPMTLQDSVGSTISMDRSLKAVWSLRAGRPVAATAHQR